MTGDGAGEIEPVGIGELLRIAVRRCQVQHDEVPLCDVHTAQIDVACGAPEDAANDSGVAKQFLYRACRQIRTRAKARVLARVAD